MRERTLTPRSLTFLAGQEKRGDNQTDGLRPLYANDCVIDKHPSGFSIAMIEMTGAGDELTR